MTHLIYDGSFAGFLTSIFEVYERKLAVVCVVRRDFFQPTLLDDHREIITDRDKSARVWTALKKKLSKRSLNDVYKAFLSELQEIERVLAEYLRYVFDCRHQIESDFADPRVLTIHQTAHKVHREKHRMEAFIRFQRTKEDIYYASIAPDFNVIPLIVGHFKDRYADQHWLIYDSKRNYGVQYNCESRAITEVVINFESEAAHEFLPDSMCHEEEKEYQRLWRDYFYSVNIGARNNKKLHVRHVPVRYWKYLTEKRC